MKRILMASVMAALPLSAPLAADTPAKDQTASERQAFPAGSMRTSDLIDREIETPDGESLGEIEDVIVSSGGAPYAIFDVGGFLGIGDHEIAVPLDRLQVSEDRVVYDTTREDLSSHPRYYFPDAPVSGSVRPGSERSQEMAGKGNPRQSAEHNLALERLGGEGDDSAVYARDGSGGLEEALSTSTPWSQRDAYLNRAGQAVDQLTKKVESARDLDDEARQDLDRYTTALQSRYESLKQASEANWSQLQENFAVQFGKVRDTYAEVSDDAAGDAPQNAERR